MSGLAELRWMLPPLAICLVLTGIHGYLGIHVIRRKVIFVDLALAQIAALGSIYAQLLGYDSALPGGGLVSYAFSLGFTFVGAALFALSRMRDERVPQEAFIGIAYAMASAIAILMLAKSPGEAEHIKEMLVGNVLLVTWPVVLQTAGIYAVIGLIHYAFRKPFLEISLSPEAAAARGRRVRLWDFAFYASFGLVITNSVAIAGVLLVFSFLVVPAVVAFMFKETIAARTAVAWAVGTACSAVGMLVSYYGDLPTGPSVVACFAGFLTLASLVYYVRGAARPMRALSQAAGGIAMLVGVFGLPLLLAKPLTVDAHDHAGDFESFAAALSSTDESAQIEAVHHLAEGKDPHAAALLVGALRASASERVSEHIIEVLPELPGAREVALPALHDLAEQAVDSFLKLELARTLLRLKDSAGFQVLLTVIEQDPSVLLAQKAGELLEQMMGSDFGLSRAESAIDQAKARARAKRWFDMHGAELRWRQSKRRFE
jgi:zinc/manganese transport system permease protein